MTTAIARTNPADNDLWATPLHEPGQAAGMTGKITRRQIIHGSISEYRRAA